MHTLQGRSLIAGHPVTASASTFRPVSPLTSQPLEPEFHDVPHATVDEALHCAEQAFTAYRQTTPAQRAELLDRIAEEITALGDPLLERAREETGLTPERLAGERGRTVGQLRLFANVVREGSWADPRIDTAQPARVPMPKVDLRRLLRPLGPVIVFGSSNFPLAFSVAGGDTASALAAGCPVIVKAHRAHPGTSEMVAGAVIRAVAACGLPPGIFGLIHGSGVEIGTALVCHPLAKAAGFTGSREGGRALFNAASARPEPIPVFAEMASLNPIFILPGAMRERGATLAEGLKVSVTMGAGQFCTKPGLVFGVAGPDFETFAETFAAAIRTVSPTTMLHGGICKSYHAGIKHLQGVAGVEQFAIAATPATPDRTEGEAVVFITSLTTFLESPALREEVFGPCTLLIRASSAEELTAAAQSLDGQLTATLHLGTGDDALAAALIPVIERKAGRLVLDGFPTGVEVCPSMNHGGPYPATTDERFTSVGTASIQRWARPVCYQNFPEHALPPELQDANLRGLMRLVNGTLTRDAVSSN